MSHLRVIIETVLRKIKTRLLMFLDRNAALFKSDRFYLRIRYYLMTGHCINFNNPKGYCEKIQWLKVYDHNPNYTTLVDKFLVKDVVAKLIGGDYVVKNLGVWEDVDDIDFNNLPNSFVLKTTHAAGSTGVIICKDKSCFSISEAKERLRKSLKLNSFPITREWPYKNIIPRIIAEEYLEDETGGLRDYKVMCFDGNPRLIQVHMGRFNGVHTQDFYDTTWQKITWLNQDYCVTSDIILPKPNCLEEMLSLSSILSKGLPHVRVDWYISKNQLYFGEMTFYDASGYDLFSPRNIELEIGDWITLPKK